MAWTNHHTEGFQNAVRRTGHIKRSGQGLGKMTPRLDATEIASSHDIIWAAGIYEGEGSCSVDSGETNGLHVRVAQKDEWLPRRLRALFGGSVRLHTDKRRNNSWFSWDVSGARARGFLSSIYELLSPRRQAQVLPVIKRREQ